jgi:hypothetical protein
MAARSTQSPQADCSVVGMVFLRSSGRPRNGVPLASVSISASWRRLGRLPGIVGVAKHFSQPLLDLLAGAVSLPHRPLARDALLSRFSASREPFLGLLSAGTTARSRTDWTASPGKPETVRYSHWLDWNIFLLVSI